MNDDPTESKAAKPNPTPPRRPEKKVPCEFEGCGARTPIGEFDESIHLPVFKGTREHMGFFCARHAAELRAGMHKERYILSRTGQDEIVIDMKPLPPRETAEPPKDPAGSE